MLNSSRRLAVALTTTILMLAAFAVSAAAAPPTCAKVNPKTGQCEITIEVPATRPINDTAPESGSGSTGPACVGYAGREVPCTDPFYGTWSNALQCYLRRLDPQPPPSDEIWAGNYPRGAVYLCGDPENSANPIIWLPQPPEAAMSPEQAARIVVRRMDLRAADIGIVPEDRPGSIGAVGAPVYMWTARGPATFGPQTLASSAGGVTITATARVARIVWTMGDGATVTCRTPGTPYEDRYGFTPSPDCGHRYTRTSAGQPGNAYPITATSFWVVDWTGPGGSAGQITLDLTSRTSIQVGELQALVAR
jgi:hypothetical protein